MELSRPVIIVPPPGDPRLGWMSTASRHWFVVDDRHYPTVEHYIASKMFEGTILENTLCEAKTVASLRAALIPRRNITEMDGRLVKETVYGRDRNIRSREGWARTRHDRLETAVRRKFECNPRLLARLLATEGADIVDRTTPENGVVLMAIRDEEIAQRSRPTSTPKISAPASDITGADGLTTEESTLVDDLIRVLEMIKMLEGSSALYPEMMDDALANILPSDVIDLVREWVASTPWSTVVRTMPRYERLISAIRDRLGATSIDKGAVLGVAVLMGSVVRWLRMDAPQEVRDTILTTARKLKIHRIVLKPIPRPYRSKIPKMVIEKPSPGERFKILAPGGIKICYVSQSRIEVWGSIKDTTRSALLATGGKMVNGRVVLPYSVIQTAEEIICEAITPSEARKIAYRMWLRARASMILSFTGKIATAFKKVPQPDLIKRLIPVECDVDPIVKETVLALGGGSKIASILSRSKILSVTPKGTTRREVYEELDRGLIGGAELDEEGVVIAIERLVVATRSKKERTADVFLAATPSRFVGSAKRYIVSTDVDAHEDTKEGDRARLEMVKRHPKVDPRTMMTIIPFFVTRTRGSNAETYQWRLFMALIRGEKNVKKVIEANSDVSPELATETQRTNENNQPVADDPKDHTKEGPEGNG